MQFSSLIGIFFIVLAFFVSSGTDNATFWDGCAGVSQMKSVFQYMAGYEDEAIQTQKNFLNQMIGVSQVKSIYHTLNHDFKAARKTQKIFYDESVQPLLEATPLIGHIKACIHLMLGDKDRGLDILKDASRSTAIFIGAGVSGPVAAYMAGVLADAVLTSMFVNASSFVFVYLFLLLFSFTVIHIRPKGICHMVPLIICIIFVVHHSSIISICWLIWHSSVKVVLFTVITG